MGHTRYHLNLQRVSCVILTRRRSRARAAAVSRDAGHVIRVSRCTSGDAVPQCERDRRARCISILGLRCFRSSYEQSSPVRVLSIRATSALSLPTRRNNDSVQSVLSSESPLLSSYRRRSLLSPPRTDYVWTTWRTDASERQLGAHFYLSSLIT